MKEKGFRLLIILFAIGLIILGISGICKSQSVSFSPTSVPLWGQTPHTAKLSVEYKDFEVLAMASTKETLYFTYNDEIIGQYGGVFLGVFYKPLKIDFKGFNFKGGVGVLNRGFPNELGERMHFTAQLSYRLTKHIGISYSHYSNGFGLWNRFNPGLDNIGIVIHI